jgi:hypothetical protein
MTHHSPRATRRGFLAGSLGAVANLAIGRRGLCAEDEVDPDPAEDDDKALVAITLDLEMSRNFPRWEDTHWDYEKGNLDEPTKAYTVEACRRVQERGGKIHCFCVARVLEQENVDWLREIHEAGHPIGNHTYDHVYVLATRLEDIQFRFRRSPWLIAGRDPHEVIAENIRLASLALHERLGIEAAGFRTPGGFADGLAGREDVQEMLLAQGFSWVSSKYPAHPMTQPMESPSEEVLAGIVAAQEAAQPFVYPSGLIEVPMSPVSDINAFRTGRWPLEDFLTAVRRAVEHVIERRMVFDFLAHPSCLVAMDPEFRAVELICELVEQSAGGAVLVDLETIARRARLRPGPSPG